MFELHPRLQADTRILGDLPLCRVLLAKDSQYPWLILVPRVANLREIHHLAPEQQQQLMQESCAVATLMERVLGPDKINVARFSSDAAWPGPIWGACPAIPYEEQALQGAAASWQTRLATLDGFQPFLTDNPVK